MSTMRKGGRSGELPGTFTPEEGGEEEDEEEAGDDSKLMAFRKLAHLKQTTCSRNSCHGRLHTFVIQILKYLDCGQTDGSSVQVLFFMWDWQAN